MLGKPVIAGTRITVELILEKLTAGETAEQILSAHPHLPAGSIRAALAFAAEALAVRGLGYGVLSIAQSSAGIVDEDVLSRANEAQSVLLAADKDFGELVFRQRRLHAGIILFRLAGLAPIAKAQVAAAAIKAHGTELEAEFCVVADRAVRIRRSRR